MCLKWIKSIRLREEAVKHFLNEFCKENKLGKKELSEKAKKKVLEYNYPGNVRELKAVIELAAVLSDEEVIDENQIVFKSVNQANNLFNKELSLKEYTDNIIKYYLEKYNDDVLLVAKKLDIGKSTIYRMLKEERENEKKQ